MRLVKGPGGRMVDARKLAGWVTMPDGERAVCPRCEGEAFIRLNGVRHCSQPCPCLLTVEAHFLAAREHAMLLPGQGALCKHSCKRGNATRGVCRHGAQKLQPCPVCQQWREGAPADGLSDLESMDPSLADRTRPRRRSGPKVRRPMTDEHRESIRAALAGRKRRPLDEDHKKCAAARIFPARQQLPVLTAECLLFSSTASLLLHSRMRIGQSPPLDRTLDGSVLDIGRAGAAQAHRHVHEARAGQRGAAAAALRGRHRQAQDVRGAQSHPPSYCSAVVAPHPALSSASNHRIVSATSLKGRLRSCPS